MALGQLEEKKEEGQRKKQDAGKEGNEMRTGTRLKKSGLRTQIGTTLQIFFFWGL